MLMSINARVTNDQLLRDELPEVMLCNHMQIDAQLRLIDSTAAYCSPTLTLHCHKLTLHNFM